MFTKPGNPTGLGDILKPAPDLDPILSISSNSNEPEPETLTKNQTRTRKILNPIMH